MTRRTTVWLWSEGRYECCYCDGMWNVIRIVFWNKHLLPCRWAEREKKERKKKKDGNGEIEIKIGRSKWERKEGNM